MKYEAKLSQMAVATGKDKLESLFFEKESGLVIATDGHILATHRVAVDVSGAVPVEALAAAKKAPAKSDTRIDLSDPQTAVVTSNGKFLGGYTRILDSIPRWRAVFPNYGKLRRPEVQIALNPALITKLAAALGSDAKSEGILLSFDLDEATTTTKPVVVTCLLKDEPTSIGLIMPMRISEFRQSIPEWWKEAGHREETLKRASKVAADAAKEDGGAEEDAPAEKSKGKGKGNHASKGKGKGKKAQATEAQGEAEAPAGDADPVSEAETPAEAVDVCLAGNPAVNGICGDAECVCAPTPEQAPAEHEHNFVDGDCTGEECYATEEECATEEVA
jgi:hypothetical protein